jgi:hypothetical protein
MDNDWDGDLVVPFFRRTIYVLLFIGCGSVAGYELYFWLAGNVTAATVLRVGRTRLSLRNSRYWAEYEYFDQHGNRHIGHAAIVPPVTAAGEQIEIQYLRHEPETSRLAPSPAKALCFGAVALLAATVFTAEILVGRRRCLPGKGDDSNQEKSDEMPSL